MGLLFYDLMHPFMCLFVSSPETEFYTQPAA